MGLQRQNVDSPTPSAAVIAIQVASLITSPDTSRARARASPWPTVLALNKHVSAGRAGYCRIASGRQGLRPVSKSANCGGQLS